MKTLPDHSITTQVDFYLLTHAKTQQPLLIKNPKDKAPEDTDVAQQPDYLYLLPYTHQSQTNNINHNIPHELSDFDARPVVFANNVFWTRAHALCHQQLCLLHNFASGRADAAKPLADKLNIRRLIKQCYVGKDNTYALPADIASITKKTFDQFCHDYDTAQVSSHVPPDERISLQQQWQKIKQVKQYQIRAAFIKQYPEVLTLLLHLWERGIIPIEQSDIDHLMTHPLKTGATAELPDTEVTLAILYNAIDRELPVDWYEDFCQQFYHQLTQTNYQINTPFKDYCHCVGTLPIFYSNLVPGTEFTPPAKLPGEFTLIDFAEPDFFDQTYRQSDLLHLQALLLDCNSRDTLSIDYSPLSSSDSTVKSITPRAEAMPEYSLRSTNSSSNAITSASSAMSTPTRAHTPAATPTETPHLQPLRTPASKTANRIRNVMMSPRLVKGSQLARTVYSANVTMAPTEPLSHSSSTNATGTHDGTTSSSEQTPVTPANPVQRLPFLSSTIQKMAALTVTTPHSFTDNSSWAGTKPSNYSASFSQTSNFTDFITPYPMRTKARTALLTETPAPHMHLPAQSPATQIMTFNQTIKVGHYVENDQHALKFLFPTTSIAKVFQRRLTHRYGLDPATITTESAAMYGTDDEDTISHQFAIVLAVPNRTSFWSFLEHTERNPHLFPHYGQAHLDLITSLTTVLNSVEEECLLAEKIFNFYNHINEYTAEKGDLATYIGLHPDITPAYQLAITKPYYPLIAYNVSPEEYTNISHIAYQYPQPDKSDATQHAAITGRMRQWFDHYLKKVVGLQKSGTRPSEIKRGTSAAHIPEPIYFNQFELTDFVRNVTLQLTPDQIKNEQATLTVHSYTGGERDSLLIAAMEQGHMPDVQSTKRDEFLEVYVKEKIMKRAEQPTKKIDNQDIGPWIFVSSVTHALIDTHSNLFSLPVAKVQYALPSINIDEYPDLYLLAERKNSPLQFKPINKKLTDNYRLDSQTRYDALIQAMGKNCHQVLVLSIEDVDRNTGPLLKTLCEIKAKCLIQALVEQDHELKLVFIAAPVINNNATLYNALQTAFTLANQTGEYLPKIIIANTQPNAAYSIIARYLQECKQSSLVQHITANLADYPVAEVVLSPNYALPLGCGLSNHTDDNEAAELESNLIDSTRLFSQHPLINREAYNHHSHYVNHVLTARDKIFSPE